MIIDKVKPFWTEEDYARLEEIENKTSELLLKMQTGPAPEDQNDDTRTGTLISYAKQLQELNNQESAIEGAVEARYIKSRSRKELIADAEEIINSVEKEDFLAYINRRTLQISELKATSSNKIDPETISALKKYAKDDYESCFFYILFYVRVQLNGLDDPGQEDVRELVNKRASLWYIRPLPDFLPMAHGKATDALAFMRSKDAEIDPITKHGTIDKFGVHLAILKLEELQSTLSISTDKLLSTAIAAFTQRNDFRHLNGKEPNRKITISLRDYARWLKYDVDEHETNTPEEAEKEKKRAKNQLDNARKAIKKDLEMIHASTLTWEETVSGKARDFARISLVTYTGIRNGEIQIAFSPEIANYLAEKNVITQYPTKLLGISGRQPTAYYIGRKLAEHYNIDNNIIRGTNDRIGIPSLLSVTGLPSFEEVQATDRGHWAERIKEPVEKALDVLTEEGILKDWKYTHARGIDLTEEEAYNITSYEDYIKLYLHFTPADKVDHTERIEAKRKRREAAQKKRTKRSNKKNS